MSIPPPSVQPDHLLEIFEEITWRKATYPQRILDRLLTLKEAETKTLLLIQIHQILIWLQKDQLSPASGYPPGIRGLAAHLQELKLELRWRERTYRHQVHKRQMSATEKDHKIHLLTEIMAMLQIMQAYNQAPNRSHQNQSPKAPGPAQSVPRPFKERACPEKSGA